MNEPVPIDETSLANRSDHNPYAPPRQSGGERSSLRTGTGGHLLAPIVVALLLSTGTLIAMLTFGFVVDVLFRKFLTG